MRQPFAANPAPAHTASRFSDPAARSLVRTPSRSRSPDAHEAASATLSPTHGASRSHNPAASNSAPGTVTATHASTTQNLHPQPGTPHANTR